MGHWVFTEQYDNVRRDPIEAELFKNNQDDNEEYAGVDTLVRETIQNSIDAASDKNENNKNVVRASGGCGVALCHTPAALLELHFS